MTSRDKGILFFGLIYSDTELYKSVKKKLTVKYGNIVFESEEKPFSHSLYYNEEMGDNLKRRYVVFEKFIRKDMLSDIKLFSVFIEKKYSDKGKRLVNIDPGYFDLARLVLASTKDFSHRIYSKNGIFHEVTLIFKDKSYRALEWTYPDYKEDFAINFFNNAREYFYCKYYKSGRERLKKEYGRVKVKLLICDIVYSVFLLMFFLLTHMNVLAEYFAVSIAGNNYYLTLLCYYFFFYSYMIFFSLPLDFISSYVLEKKYNLSNQTLLGWFTEEWKKKILGYLGGICAVLPFYYFAVKFENFWWLATAVVWILFSVLLGKIVPVFIVPLFYKYSGIDDAELYEKIRKLAASEGLDVSSVYSINLSKTTKKANAAFMGMGKSKRVVLSDTLLDNFNHNEILTVLAHEIGHYKHAHLLKLIFISSVTTVIAFYLFSIVSGYLFDFFNIDGITDVAGMPILFLFFSFFSFLVMPINNWFSRIMEYEADGYAVKITSDTNSFISAMNKLSEQNLSDPAPDKIIELIFYSHPSIKNRIKAIAKGMEK